MELSAHKRHIAKAITWRFIGTLDTIIISWVISGDPMIGFQVGLAEVLTKMVLYYFHERVWFRTKLAESSNWRHIYKTISWRIIGTIDTMILAWLISGDVLIGLQIGFIEIVTKMSLYYIHERTWYKINYGLKNREKKYNH